MGGKLYQPYLLRLINFEMYNFISYLKFDIDPINNKIFELQRRLHKELMKLATDPPDGITIDPQTLEGKDLSM